MMNVINQILAARENLMMHFRFGIIGILMMLLCAACGSSDNQTLPTLAEIASDVPTTAVTTAPNEVVDTEPTPTREVASGTTPQTAVPTANPGAGSDFDPNALNPFELGGVGFAADINGSETLRLQGDGGLRCGENNTFILESSSEDVPRLAFRFPRTILPGDYFLRDVVAESIAVRPMLVLASGENYDSQLDGVFILKTFATTSTATISGDFEYSAVSLTDPTKSILIRGGFNFSVQLSGC